MNKKLNTRLFFLILILTIIIPTLLFGQIRVNNTWINQNIKEGALVFDQANTIYIFDVDFSAQGCAIFVLEKDITIDLNGHTITFNNANRDGTIGVYPCRQRSAGSLGADDVNYSFTSRNNDNAGINMNIRNGRILNAGTQNGGQWATCIGAYYAGGDIGILENLYLETTGKDGMVVNFNFAGFTLRNTYGVNYSNSTNNRHNTPGNVKSGGSIIAYNNILLGGNNSIVAKDNSLIYQNVLRQSGFATNGYSVHYYRVNGCSTYYNIMIPYNGRGIMHNAGEHHVSYGNLICVLEKPNQEYGTALNPPAIRMRYEANQNRFYNNTCLGIAGITQNDITLTSTSPIYLSQYSGYKNYIFGNRFWAIHAGGATSSRYANALTIEQGVNASSAELAQDSIFCNDFRSNQFLLRLGGWDGACYQNEIINNSYNWISGDSALKWFSDSLDNFNWIRPELENNDYATQTVYDSIIFAFKTSLSAMINGVSDDPTSARKTFHTGYNNFDGYISIIDAELGAGVSMETSDIAYVGTTGNSVNDILIGHSLWVIAKDSNDVAIKNKNIYVNDNQGLYFSSRTDATGLVRLQLIDYSLTKPFGTRSFSKIIRSDHRANIEYLGSVELPVYLRNSKSNPLIIIFPGDFLEIPVAPLKLEISN